MSDGYSRNFIIHKKLGLEATPKSLNDLKLHKAGEEKKAQQLLDEANALSDELSSKTVHLKIKTGEGGKVLVRYLPKKSPKPCRNSMA